ncbi:MAG: helix-turn-helix transcriptional regulator [Synergistaceae bacterium]|nr:helix-turn-helix transcriptional regulator [Synergistaceae bacterium]
MLGDKIKEFRSAKGWTQSVLAEKLDVSVGYISEIETGRRTPSLATLVTIIKLLDCSPNDIFEFSSKTDSNLCADCALGNIDDTIRATVEMMSKMRPEERFKVFTYAKDQKNLSEYFRKTK